MFLICFVDFLSFPIEMTTPREIRIGSFYFKRYQNAALYKGKNFNINFNNNILVIYDKKQDKTITFDCEKTHAY